MFCICEIHQNLFLCGQEGKDGKGERADRRQAQEILYKRGGLAWKGDRENIFRGEDLAKKEPTEF